ncbi:MAG: sugar phosphate isomerase/epimerase [Nanoarchaeota archaeon]|nr:sugar phosphate isomerase/epimerase [Nanoarchaeota archaeon]
MNVGISTVCVGDDILRAIEVAKKFNCKFVQWTIKNFPSRNLIRKVKKEKKVKFILHPIFDLDKPLKILNLMQEINSKLLIVHLRKKDLKDIKRMQRFFESKGITLAVENSHLKDKYFSIKDFKNLTKEMPNVKIVLDINHARECNVRICKFYEKFKKYIVAFHVSDTIVGKGYHLPIGYGKTNFKKLRNIFEESKDKIFILEIRSIYEDKIGDSLDRIKKWLAL